MRERIKIMESMHNIIKTMNNENAYYGYWIQIVPDEATEEDLYDVAINNELFAEATAIFKLIMKNYLKDGLVIDNKLY